ncbi:MAG: phosphatidylcholine/phosphatidylserine synthase [Sedimentisphaerales bacterium]|nr:phosphatidylcholine/phosphatidylserine synthase [Sedimentisphaerales bacterium]
MTNRFRRQHKTRRLRRVAVMPSLVTLLNGVCGFAAIHFTARGMNEPDRLWLEKPELTFFAAAAWMIFLAMICDGLDGFLARLSRGTSGFGAQLDSLADVISFGVAPAFLMLRVVENHFQGVIGPVSPVFGSIPGKLLWLGAVMYVCCAALRLARFNVEHGRPEVGHDQFSGLPSPAAAGVVASLVLLYGDLVPEIKPDVPGLAQIGGRVVIHCLPWITVLVALLMVSRIPYGHVINQYVRGRRPFGHVVRIVILLLFLYWKPQLTLSIVFIFYAAFPAVRALWQVHLKRLVVRHSSVPAGSSEQPEHLSELP